MTKHLIFLIFLCTLFPLIWFYDGKLQGGGEESIPFYDIQRTLELTQSIWRDSNTGYATQPDLSRLPFIYLLYFVSLTGITGVYLQAIMTFILMVTGTLGMYLLMKNTFDRHLELSYFPLLASIFYLLNPYTMSQVFGRGLYMQQYPFALFPLALYLLVQMLKNKKIVFVPILILISFVFSGAFGNPTYALSFWFIQFTFLIFYMWQENFMRKLKLFLLFTTYFVLWILTQLWWILPFLIQPLTLGISTDATRINIESLIGVSNHFPLDLVIRLMQKYIFFIANSYGDIYSGFIFGILSWLIPICAMFSIYFLKRLRFYKFYLSGFLLSLFFCSGANPPFGWLFIWLLKVIPQLQSFRNPYEKFGLVLLIFYTPLVILGVIRLSSILFKGRYSGLVLLTIIILVSGVLVWPMWTGRVNREEGNRNRFYVPSYYREVDNYFKSIDQKLNYRIFVVPMAGGDGVSLKWGDSIYAGVEPYQFTFHSPTVSNAITILRTPHLTQSIRKLISRNDVIPAVSLMRGKYVLIRNDLEIGQIDQYQKGYLLSAIFPPIGIKGSQEIQCQSNPKPSSITDGLWLVCNLEGVNQNWNQAKYLHLQIETDTDSQVEIALRDKNDYRPRWDGRNNNDYITRPGGVSEILIPLGLPSEGKDGFDYQQVKMIEILAHSNQQIKNLSLRGIWVDRGFEKSVDNLIFLRSFGKLELYENKNISFPPEVGLLNRIETVDKTDQIIPRAVEFKDQLDKVGILSKEQNNNPLELSEPSLNTKVESLRKFDNTKFWLNFSGREHKYLQLSKTFESGWKVIPNIDLSEVGDSLNKLWNLTTKPSLNENKHIVINGYANGWLIDDQIDQVLIIYLPQVYQEIGWIISTRVILTMVAVLLLGVLFNLFKPKGERF